MLARIKSSRQQLVFLDSDLQRLVNKRWWRWLTIWTAEAAHAVIWYRMSRCLYLLLGAKLHTAARLATSPILLLLATVFKRCDISHMADIGPGLAIAHPSLGVVVSAYTTAGKSLSLTGGNCFGMRGPDRRKIVLGNSVMLGVNAVVLGPLTLGNKVVIAAGAVVTHDAPDQALLAGVPARQLEKKNIPDTD